MQIKIDKGERVAVFIHPEYREMLNEISLHYQRGQRDQLEALIKREHLKIEKPKLKVIT